MDYLLQQMKSLLIWQTICKIDGVERLKVQMNKLDYTVLQKNLYIDQIFLKLSQPKDFRICVFCCK